MRIQCDVCDNHQATVFCVADEAALCPACDHRVHHANKLAGKHPRFSLHQPSAKQSPICDICQEKRAFLFCQQDRAILCSDCDVSIHNVNQHTQKHSRFLLTGLRLSPNSTIYSSDSSAPIPKPPHPIDNPVRASPTNAQKYYHDEIEINSSSISSSSISEYLIETLPGWHVEELLDSTNYAIPSPSGNLSNKSGGEDDVVMPFWDADLEGNNWGAFGIEKMGHWVPQGAPTLSHHVSIPQVTSGEPIGIKEMSKEFGSNMITTKSTSSRKWSQQTSLVVPQMTLHPPPHPTASKRLRRNLC